jgi:hypothetical protein
MAIDSINPWLGIWTQPRKTLRSILNSNPKKIIIWLAIIGGIFSGFTLFSNNWFQPKAVSYYLLIFCTLVIAGAIIGIIHLYLAGWLLTMTGAWIGGKGNFTEVKCAVGWSNYPFIIADILAILVVLATKILWLKFLVSIVYVIVGIWAIIIFMKLIGEAHQFSAWKGLLAFVIAFILVAVVIMIIALLVPLLAPLFR